MLQIFYEKCIYLCFSFSGWVKRRREKIVAVAIMIVLLNGGGGCILEWMCDGGGRQT